MRVAIMSILVLLISISQTVLAECFGDGEYQVCSDTSTDSNGDIHVRSWDTEGNTYSINTESHSTNDETKVRSYDSEGNEYSIKSWSDSTGHHTEDSEGNHCTITTSGLAIGCD